MQKFVTSDEVKTNTAVIVSKDTLKTASVTSVFGTGGWAAIRMPTPAILTNIFRVLLYAAAIISFCLPLFPEIPETMALKIGNWALRIVTIIHFISKMFGIDINSIIPPGSQSTEKK